MRDFVEISLANYFAINVRRVGLSIRLDQSGSRSIGHTRCVYDFFSSLLFCKRQEFEEHSKIKPLNLFSSVHISRREKPCRARQLLRPRNIAVRARRLRRDFLLTNNLESRIYVWTFSG